MAFVSAIIVAGGSSRRMKGTDKLLLDIGGQTVIERTVKTFGGNALINEIIIAAGQGNIAEITRLCGSMPKVKAVVAGGSTRALSVQNGIAAASKEENQYYAIQDGARPFASDELITRVITAAQKYGAAAPGLPVNDTIKEIDSSQTIVRTPNRAALVSIATPQVFEATLYRAASKGCTDAYDDCQLLERVGRKVQVVEGERTNIKITEPVDISRAQQIAGINRMRIGHGYDVHRYADGRDLILGGVKIPFERGLLGHSDADVLIHAIMDALLGAASLPDIGANFPDTDPQYEGASSVMLLERVAQMLGEAGYAVGNIDATIICQRPKLRPHIDVMRQNIAKALNIETSCVNVKATTEEGLGFTGEMQGIATHAVALLCER